MKALCSIARRSFPFFALVALVLVSMATGYAGERAEGARRLYDIQEQLTCGGPAGKGPAVRSTVTVDHFRIDDDVWVTVPPDMAGEEAWLHVLATQEGKRLADGALLADVSGVIERVIIDEDAGNNQFLIWKGPLVEGEYQVVVDFAPLGSYERGQDLLDGMSATGVGFRVAYPLIDYLRIEPHAGNNVVEGGCTRVRGTGLPQFLESFKAYAWNNGPNGTPEDGGGDDVNIGQVVPTWSTDVDPWIGTINEYGWFESGIDYRCGEGLVFAEYEYFKIGEGTVVMSDTATIAKIPPAWIP
jgi:hypothetical protein